jgi:DNA-binding Lrp family transcriptional regulator
LNLAEMLGKNNFPDEPLDSRDRKLIQAIYEKGAKGIGFNKLVDATRSFASRSTVAARMQKLVELGYLERKRGKGLGKEKPMRVTFKCYTLMLSVDKTRETAAKLHSQIRSMRESGGIGEEEAKRLWGELRVRYNSFFGMVGTMAVFYGTSAAGDLFLPLVVEDYKSLLTEFMETVRERPELLRSIRSIIDEQAASGGVDLEEVRRKTRDEVLDPAVYRFRTWDDGVDPRSG